MRESNREKERKEAKEDGKFLLFEKGETFVEGI